MVSLWYLYGIINGGRTEGKRGEDGEKAGNHSLADLIRNKSIVLIRLKYL